MPGGDGESRRGGRFPFTPYPAGWYRIGAGAGLRRGAVKPLRCLGRDFALYRTDAGRPVLIDAYCPHMGAHLGRGGKVVGEAIECPFHGWRVGDGGLVRASRGGREAHGACARRWTVVEAGAGLYLWHGAEGAAPAWDLPREVVEPPAGWSRFRLQKPLVLRTHVQEVAENGVDLAHFAHVHSGQIDSVRTAGLDLQGPRLTHRIDNSLRIYGLAGKWLPPTDGVLEFTYYGLGMVRSYAEVSGFPRVAFLSIIHALPIDEDHVQVQAEFSIRRMGPATWPLYAVAAREARRAIRDDTAILEHKAYLEAPRLTAADGPIMQFRDWARQFYGGSRCALSAVG